MQIIAILAFVVGWALVYFAFYPVKGDDIFQVYLPLYVYAAIWALGTIVWLIFRSSKLVIPLIGVILLCSIALPVWTLLTFDNERLRYNAARYGHHIILKTLLTLHGLKQYELDKALVDSTLGADAEMVKYLLSKSASPNAKLQMSEPVLISAVQRGSAEVTNLLLQSGANVNATDKDGMTATMWAAQNNQLDTLRLLIAADADTTARNNRGETALMIAHRFDHQEIEQLLTKNQ